ncbi:unnamed protein product [Moneuplotes crassus]|uniref:Uncharacterized protein n=1 Tax=Euplotes crassus TaxID=5936 RepID=A0AAD2D3J1_EUPCR|nr:unnamed protein product [Moneuplotes crassus]
MSSSSISSDAPPKTVDMNKIRSEAFSTKNSTRRSKFLRAIQKSGFIRSECTDNNRKSSMKRKGINVGSKQLQLFKLDFSLNDKIQLFIAPYSSQVEFLDYMRFKGDETKQEKEYRSLWSKVYSFLFNKDTKIFLGNKGNLERALEKLKNSQKNVTFYDAMLYRKYTGRKKSILNLSRRATQRGSLKAQVEELLRFDIKKRDSVILQLSEAGQSLSDTILGGCQFKSIKDFEQFYKYFKNEIRSTKVRKYTVKLKIRKSDSFMMKAKPQKTAGLQPNSQGIKVGTFEDDSINSISRRYKSRRSKISELSNDLESQDDKNGGRKRIVLCFKSVVLDFCEDSGSNFFKIKLAFSDFCCFKKIYSLFCFKWQNRGTKFLNNPNFTKAHTNRPIEAKKNQIRKDKKLQRILSAKQSLSINMKREINEAISTPVALTKRRLASPPDLKSPEILSKLHQKLQKSRSRSKLSSKRMKRVYNCTVLKFKNQKLKKLLFKKARQRYVSPRDSLAEKSGRRMVRMKSSETTRIYSEDTKEHARKPAAVKMLRNFTNLRVQKDLLVGEQTDSDEELKPLFTYDERAFQL